MSDAVGAKRKSLWLLAVGLIVLSVMLSLTTALFSTVPLMALRRTMGRNVYLALSALAIGLLGYFVSPELGATLLVAVSMVGIYLECEELGLRILPSAAVSLLFSSGIALSFLTYFAQVRHTDIFSLFQAGVELFTQQALVLDPQIKLDTAALAQQVPSAVLIAMMVALWVALLWSGREQYYLHARKEYEPLMAFTLPDFSIWFLLASLAGTFLELGQGDVVKMLAVNGMNIMAVLFFFQGLAVVGTFFRLQRFSAPWRVFGYVVLVFQLFLFVCALGLVDYWGDFRMKMIKRSAERIGEV